VSELREPEPPHLDAFTVAAFIDGGLDEVERARLVSHVADCSVCRQEIADVRAARRRPVPRTAWWMAGVVAAGLAGILVVGPLLGDDEGGPTFRSAPAGRSSVIMLVPPDTIPAGQSPVFMWRAVASDAIYTLVVMDERADVVWRVDGTRDTTAAIPPDRLPGRDGTLLYTLDARLPDGRIVTTGTRRTYLRR